jgi:hypothetical protein
MTTTLRIELTDEIRVRLEAAVAEANKMAALAGCPQFTLAQCVAAALAKGLSLPPTTPPDKLPLVALTVAQFAQVTGLGDLAEARANAARACAHQKQIADGVQALFKDVERVAAIHEPIRLKTPDEVDSWAKGVQESIKAHPHLSIALCYAVVNEADGGYGMPPPKGVN